MTTSRNHLTSIANNPWLDTIPPIADYPSRVDVIMARMNSSERDLVSRLLNEAGINLDDIHTNSGIALIVHNILIAYNKSLREGVVTSMFSDTPATNDKTFKLAA